MVEVNFIKQKESLIGRKETYDYQRRKGKGINWEAGIEMYTLLHVGFPGGSDGKESTFYAGDLS